MIFHSGKTCVVFRHSDRLLLWFAGLPDVPGSVHGFFGLFSGCASFREAVRGIFFLTAGVASISSLEVGRRCLCEAVRRSSGCPVGVTSGSVGVGRFSRRGASCVSTFSPHEESK
ncbi:hypothetical protein NDU88_004583 [Pleurodeles waltl]|uniref:Uncharacterized protein n=1 Tax=Pleurodeles waltl TaxID=8319 RepID=A0AAV7LLU5_PLEWA|nr:hypothetical protein NDU88_004583 [Pleurodeles waltl]